MRRSKFELKNNKLQISSYRMRQIKSMDHERMQKLITAIGHLIKAHNEKISSSVFKSEISLAGSYGLNVSAAGSNEDKISTWFMGLVYEVRTLKEEHIFFI